MRRALQAFGPLLRRSTSAASPCSELCAASGPALAAAAGWPGRGGGGGSGSGGGPLIPMPWALRSQAALHASVAAQLAAHSGCSVSGAEGSDGCSGDSSSKVSSGSSTAFPRKRGGRQPSPVPDVDAGQLLRSLGLEGTAQPAKLLTILRKLRGVRQQGVLDNAVAVMSHLLSPAVGLTRQQAGQLLERCPELFSWAPEQRVAVLFGELKQHQVTATAAAQCLMAFPAAAQTTTLAPGLAELAAILAHSRDREGGSGRRAAVPAAQRTVAVLLSRIPSAMQLVCNSAGYLQQRAADLQQAGFTAADVAALAWALPEMLWIDAAARVAAAAAVLQQELGLPAAELVSLAARRKPRWLASNNDTLRERAAALAEGFGRPAAAAMLQQNIEILSCDRNVWQRNLCYMAACGVADPKAVLRRAPNSLRMDHAAPSFLQRRLLLQHSLQLTAVQLYEQHPGCLTRISTERLVQRLQFMEQRGQELSRSGIMSGKHDRFLAAVGAGQAEWEAWAAANPPEACLLYGWAQQAAEEEAARLTAALPPELAHAERRVHARARRKSAVP